MKILGIETSCDETASAVVDNGQVLLSNAIASSVDLHAHYGGVVPEIAARSHIEYILPVIEQALSDAKCSWEDIDAIAVTQGPGLGGSLSIGVLTARTLAIAKNKPLYAVNHVMAHLYANFLTSSKVSGYSLTPEAPEFPLLAIIVSGGHSLLVLFKNHFEFHVLGQTRDDAIGEAFDKVAKILGLPYPGGPAIAELAKSGNPKAYSFPKAKMDKYDFSFSGLKTAVLRTAQAEINESYDFPSHQLPGRLSESQKADIAASFQAVAVSTVVDKVQLAYQEFKPKSIVISGGVAANSALRQALDSALPITVYYPDLKLCTDNAAMVASLGYYCAKFNYGLADPYTLEVKPSLAL